MKVLKAFSCLVCAVAYGKVIIFAHCYCTICCPLALIACFILLYAVKMLLFCLLSMCLFTLNDF